MDPVFHSKIDRWLLWVMVGSAVISVLACIPALLAPDWRIGLIVVPILLFTALFVLWIFRSTNYTVGAEVLLIRGGPFRWRVRIKDIVAITPTSNPLSSPALSLDRLEIRDGRGSSIMVSPADKEGFIAALKQRGACAGDDVA